MGRRPSERRATREEIRALAHPIRFRMVELLREGPATASQLARRIGESSGSTSYHLRVLERAGVVSEDAALGNGRDRWWRRVDQLLYIAPEDDVEGRALGARMRSIFFARDDEARRRFVAAEPELDQDWRDGSFVGAWYADLTPQEAREHHGKWVAEEEQVSD